MSSPAAPKSSNPADAGDNPVPSPAFEDQVHTLWKKYGNFLIGLCAVFAVGIIAKGAWDYLAQQRELGVQRDYQAAITPEALRSFASSHPGEVLAGVAELRLADDAFAAGRTTEAVIGYGRAVDAIKTGPLAARARLGLAVAKLQSGEGAEAEASLRDLASDVSLPAPVRAEADYQLASSEAASGRYSDVQRIAAEIIQIDSNSPWAQRAFALEASLPRSAAPAPSSPSSSFFQGPPAGSK
jgi:hypothetical protein